MTAVPTPDGLRNMLVEILTGAAGETEDHWRNALGLVEKLPVAMNVRSNWRVAPTGNRTDLATIERAVAIVREAHPYVAGGDER
jgi:hypothetical protein